MKNNFRKFARDVNNVWQLFKNMNDGLLITNEKLEVIAVNPAFSQITGYTFKEIAGQNPRFLQAGVTERAVYKQMWDEITNNGSWTGELINKRKNGEKFFSFITITHIKNDDNNSYYIGIMRDITKRREKEKHHIHLAYHDPLTELPNRLFFMKEISRIIEDVAGSDYIFPVLFLDLNEFKVINDTFGHQAGDKLLVELARRLSLAIGPDGIVSRFGGDEFTILLLPSSSRDLTHEKIAAIIETFSQPFYCSDQQVYMSTSIGVSFYPEHGVDPDTLMKHADRAMYVSKGKRGNNVEYYDDHREVGEQFYLEQELRHAIEQSELDIYYQLQIDVENGKPFGVEALVRWEHPEHGLIPPNVFLPIAEELGILPAVDEWVMERAVRELKRWHDQGRKLSLSVNVSEQSFRDERFIEYVEQLLKEKDFPPQSLCLEISEQVAELNIEQSESQLNKLRALGVSVSLDNFGKGLSSLQQLASFPIDMFKIDRSFIHNIGENEQSQALVKLMIAVAKNLNYKVIAQGVETLEQLSMVENEGCLYVQGYLFSEPLSAADCEKLLTSSFNIFPTEFPFLKGCEGR